MNVSYININQSDTLKYSIKNDIFINLNDAGLYSSRFIKKTISKYRRKFLLSIASFEADMINFFDENSKFTEFSFRLVGARLENFADARANTSKKFLKK